jgi:hypothetical protein
MRKNREVQFGQEQVKTDQIKCHKSPVLGHDLFRRHLVGNIFESPFVVNLTATTS